MAELTQKAENVVASFALQPGVAEQDMAALRKIIASSPVLQNQINRSADKGWLDQIAVLPVGSNMGGGFSDSQDKLLLPLKLVRNSAKSSAGMAEAVFVLGHELQHAANSDFRRAADAQFAADVRQIAGQQTPVHDYTQALEKRIDVSRKDEAMAHLSGWNAVVRFLEQSDDKLTLKDLYNAAPQRMADFIDVTKTKNGPRYTLKPGLTLNADMTLGYTDANIDAMGNYFFEKSAAKARLGRFGDSDYTNYYAAAFLGTIVREERAHAPLMQPPGARLTLNMKQLGLSEDRLQHNGVDVGPGKNGVQTYFDSSSQPQRQGRLDETGIARQHTPRDPEHPDHALYMQVRNAVGKMYGIGDKQFTEAHENVAAGLFYVAKQKGFERVSHAFVTKPQDGQAPVFYVSEWPPKHFPAHVGGLKQEQFGTLNQEQWFAQSEGLSAQHALAKAEALQQQLQPAPAAPGR